MAIRRPPDQYRMQTGDRTPDRTLSRSQFEDAEGSSQTLRGAPDRKRCDAFPGWDVGTEHPDGPVQTVDPSACGPRPPVPGLPGESPHLQTQQSSMPPVQAERGWSS